MPNKEDLDRLISHVQTFKNQCEKWFKLNRIWANCLFGSAIGFSLGATIAGAFNQAHVAASLSAVAGSAAGLQKYFQWNRQAAWYGRAITRCDDLLLCLNRTDLTDKSYELLFEQYRNLRKEEGLPDTEFTLGSQNKP